MHRRAHILFHRGIALCAWSPSCRCRERHHLRHFLHKSCAVTPAQQGRDCFARSCDAAGGPSLVHCRRLMPLDERGAARPYISVVSRQPAPSSARLGHDMTSMSFRRLLLIGLLFLIWPVSNLQAQSLTSATVVGTVRDSSGAVVQAATVRIRQPQTDAVCQNCSETGSQSPRCPGPAARPSA
jgi:hypothetical protein